jgi:hypothetical protein
MLRDERFECRDGVSVGANLDSAAHQLFGRRKPELVESGSLALRERLVEQISERRTAPKRKRTLEIVDRAIDIAARGLPDGGRPQLLEPSQVGVRIEEVARAACPQRLLERRDPPQS